MHSNKKTSMYKLISALLAVVLVVTMVPALAFAGGEEVPAVSAAEDATGGALGTGEDAASSGETVLGTSANPGDGFGGVTTEVPVGGSELQLASTTRIASEITLDKAVTPYEIAATDAGSIESVKIDETQLIPLNVSDVIEEDEEVEWWAKDNNKLVLADAVVSALAVDTHSLKVVFADGSEETVALKITDSAIVAGGIAPLAQTSGGNSLTLNVDPDGGGFVDADTLATPNAINWPVLSGTKQVRIDATFASQSDNNTRTIEVVVPKGLTIVEYTAMQGVDVEGVVELYPSDEVNQVFASSVLTAVDGSSFVDQAITGYNTTNNTIDSEPYRTYSGKVIYSFNSNVQTVQLTLTLGIDQSILSHAAATQVLSDITAKMQNGNTNLQTYLRATATGIAVPRSTNTTYQEDGGERAILGNVSDGSVEKFPVGFSYYSYSSASQNHFLDSYSFTVSYPEGTTFAGFKERTLGIDRSNTTPDKITGTYADGKLTVINDELANTVTFQYSDVLFQHTSGRGYFQTYWTADMNEVVAGTWDGTSTALTFTNTMDAQSGACIDKQVTHAQSSISMDITVESEGWNITVAGSNRNIHDLNAGSKQHPYGHALGYFSIANEGPSVVEDLVYTWKFDDSLGVRAVTMPGVTANTITKVTAKVKGGSRTEVVYDAVITPSTSSAQGTFITASRLGLTDAEYITELVIEQTSLDPYVYSSGTMTRAGNFYGRIQGGQTGTATLTISVPDSGFSVSSTSTPNLQWTRVGIGSMTTEATNNTTTGNQSWHPGDNATITSTYTVATASISEQNDIIDPIIVISLPKGVNLDQTSVRALSRAGKSTSASDFFDLVQVGSPTTQTINNVEWTTYKFTSQSYMDMLALSALSLVPGSSTGYGNITVEFEVNVSTSCVTYPNLKTTDVVLWDFGRTAVTGISGDYTVADTNNFAGKGTTYRLGGATTNSDPFSVVPKPGLNVSLGIRTAGAGTDFYTYDGTEATIAPVTPSNDAQIYLSYSNTAPDEYKKDSVIYLPIPKKDLNYGNYFNNISSTPYDETTNKPTNYSVYLKGPLTLAGFTTYYTTDTTGGTNAFSSDNGTWTPDTGYTWTTTPSSWADVTMVKFVANAPIASGATDRIEFNVGVDVNAALGEQNFWRSFQKGVTGEAGTALEGRGTWVYGSVIAAEPAAAGVSGMLFEESGTPDGTMAATGEAYDNSAEKVKAYLQSSAMGRVALKLNSDGTFSTTDENGNPYFLKAGTYTVTIENADNTLCFTTVTPSSRSNGTNWYMDIAQANVSGDHTSATYEFTITTAPSADNLSTRYVGVGLMAKPEITYTAGLGATFVSTSALVAYGATPSGTIPVLDTTNTTTGYNPDTQVWTLNKAVTLTDGTVVLPNAPLTRAQLAMVKVTEDVTATVTLSQYTYTVTASVVDAATTGGSVTVGTSPVTYNGSSLITATAAAGYEIDYLTVNGTAVTPTASVVSDLNTYSYTISNITENKTVFVKFKAQAVAVSYTTGYGANAAWTGFSNGTLASAGNFNGSIAEAPDANPTRSGYTFAGWKVASASPFWQFATDGTPTALTIANGVAGSNGAYTLTLAAQWTEKKVAVTYMMNDGTTNPFTAHTNKTQADSGDFDKTIAERPNVDPTRAGYTFEGWRVSGGSADWGFGAGGTALTTLNGVVGADTSSPTLTLNARWSAKTVAVTYYDGIGTGNGTAYESSSIDNAAAALQGTFDGELTRPDMDTPSDDPERAGYTFTGWKVASTSPVWVFTGEGTATKLTVANGVTGATSATPTLTLVAQWSAEAVTVTYLMNDGTSNTHTPSNGAAAGEGVYDGTIAAAPTNKPTRDGYTFQGWSLHTVKDSTLWGFGPGGTALTFTNGVVADTSGATPPVHTLTLNALWTEDEVDITYLMNDGTTDEFNGFSNPEASTGDYDATLTEPNAIPYRAGYEFLGWKQVDKNIDWSFGGSGTALTLANGVVKSLATPPVYTLTLTAQWQILPVEVSYLTGYGSNGAFTSFTNADAKSANYGATVSSAPNANPSRTGYTFAGWKVAGAQSNWVFGGAGTGTALTLANGVAEDDATLPYTYTLTLEAQWNINYYTVNFVDWNGSVLSTQSVAYGSGASAPANPSRVGYTFTGWDKAYNNITGNLTVNALYTINTFTVTFLDWNGSVLATRTVNYGASALAPADPVRVGYTFTGWDRGYANVTSNLTVNATYTPLAYTITFISYGNTVIQTSTVNYGESVTPPAEPRRTGYTFEGWDKPNSAWTNVTADATIRANWDEETTGTTVTPGPTGPGTTTTTTTTYEEQLGNQTGNPFVDIAEGNVPLGSFGTLGAWSLLSLLLVALGLISSLVLTLLTVRRLRRERKDERQEEDEYEGQYAASSRDKDEEDTRERNKNENKSFVVTVIAIVAAVIALVVWLLLDDLTQPMVWINAYTIIAALFFIAHVVLVAVRALLLKFGKQKDDEEQEQQESEGYNPQTV